MRPAADRRKNHKKRIWHSVIGGWVVITLSFGLIGPTAAGFAKGNNVYILMETGKLETVFTYFDHHYISPDTSISTETLEMSPGEQRSFEFEIENQGTIPVNVHPEIQSSDSLVIQAYLDENVLDPGCKTKGSLELSVPDYAPGGSYEFTVELHSEQWNTYSDGDWWELPDYISGVRS